MDTTPTTRLAAGVRRWALPPLVAAAVAVFLLPPAAPVLLAVAGFVVWFFRDPERSPPAEGVLAPADGHVSVVRTDDDRVRVGIFMSPLDVHVTRAPTDGVVERLDHRVGGHWPAFTKESERNERLEYRVGGVDGALIAGWFARRITPYLSSDDRLARGQRIGHIAFGSRADVVLPPTYDLDDVAVSVGDAVRAGETVVAARDETPADTGDTTTASDGR
jgi:phosphatidylserine decarboxylase